MEVKKDETQASESQKEVEKKDTQASEGQGDEQIDYKAELEKVKVERDNYKQGMLNAKDQLKKKGDKAEKEEVMDDDADDQSEVEVLKRRLDAMEKNTFSSAFDAMIGQFTTDPDEQALIKFHFENSVGNGGTLAERIENAQLIANKKQILKQTSEMRRALENKSGVSRVATGGGGNQDQEKGSKEFFSPEQIAMLKKRGLDPKKVEENFLKFKR